MKSYPRQPLRFWALIREYAEQGITDPAELDLTLRWELCQEFLRTQTLLEISDYMAQIEGAYLVSMTVPNSLDESAYRDIQAGMMEAVRDDIAERLEAHAPDDGDSTPAEDDAPHWAADARYAFREVSR